MMDKQIFNKLSVVIFLTCVMAFASCKDEKLYPDVSDVEVDFQVIPFYQELNSVDTTSVLTAVQPLQIKYSQFFKAYNQQIIKLGSLEDEKYPDKLISFINYDANKDIVEKAKEVFPSHNTFTKELENGFKHYRHYFPTVVLPDVYLMVSGFSQSIAVDANWVGISIEKYLGSDCEFYEWLGVAQYLRKGMTKEKMAPDVLRAIALTNYSYNDEVNDVINHMVYTGKVRYFVHRMFPELSDTLLFDYSAYQLKWCRNHEADMWASLVEWKHIFSNDRMLIQKYTGDAPFTANFGDDSAPRGGEYIGYKIVEAYMKENEAVTLEQLMKERDGRKILAASNYRP